MARKRFTQAQIVAIFREGERRMTWGLHNMTWFCSYTCMGCHSDGPVRSSGHPIKFAYRPKPDLPVNTVLR